MRKVDEKNKSEEDEYSRANHGHIISPEDEEGIGDGEGHEQQDEPEEHLGSPPTCKLSEWHILLTWTQWTPTRSVTQHVYRAYP